MVVGMDTSPAEHTLVEVLVDQRPGCIGECWGHYADLEHSQLVVVNASVDQRPGCTGPYWGRTGEY